MYCILVINKHIVTLERVSVCDDGSSLCSEVLQSAMAQKAIETGLEPSVVEKTILEKINQTGSSHSSLEELMEDCQNNSQELGTVAAAC